MKRFFLFILLAFAKISLAQTTVLAPGGYKNINVVRYSQFSDYSRVLILLHEAYSGTILGRNLCIGTITALRGAIGAWNRVNIAEVNTASAYTGNSASITSTYNNGEPWKLKTCVFNNKTYLAVEVPYNDSYHDQGYKFTGWSESSGESLLAIPYQINGTPVNTNVLSNIQDFEPTQATVHNVTSFSVLGNVGIGTAAPTERLSVKGNVRAQEIKVEMNNWPDYVFNSNYKLKSLPEIEKHIKSEGHLPGIPSAKEAEANGVSLGEMNKKLLEKVEELTLHLIEKDKQVTEMRERLLNQEEILHEVLKQIENLRK